ncbi:late embryogenesis abundant protein At1g64065-like [Primulina huaijiensis]|uniref:late embryogenesis abundant protein At1g64065-like n=1 Tax=Primulina huaijiensis TaxID=1492673 RepID=UPI003CC6E55C
MADEGEESILKSLRTSKKYPKSDETEPETSKPYIPPPQHKESSNKCFVYILVVIVLLSIAFLVFGLAVLRITTPSIRLSSVTIKNLNYSSSLVVASLNMTAVAEIRVQNKNFGPFKFGGGNMTVLYGNTRIGVASIYGGRIGSRKHEGINVTIDVIKGDFADNNANFSKDFDSGLLKLMGFTELRGEIQVMKIMNRHRTAVMSCSMDLNLTSQAVQDLLCQ